MRRRNRQQPAPRDPHPDPRREAELQRILSLRRAIARMEAAIGEAENEKHRLHRDFRADPSSYSSTLRLEQAERLQEQITGWEAEIPGLHDQIDERIGKLDDSDLAYL